MDVMKKIAEIVAEQTGKDASEITKETTFESLGVDSLDIVEMVMKFEEELDVEIELQERFTTIGELVGFIESKINA